MIKKIDILKYLSDEVVDDFFESVKEFVEDDKYEADDTLSINITVEIDKSGKMINDKKILNIDAINLKEAIKIFNEQTENVHNIKIINIIERENNTEADCYIFIFTAD